MNFRFIDRGIGASLVLLPGWGFLSEIFLRLDLPFDYILPAMPIYGNISQGLYSFLRAFGIKSVSLLGWSMGAYQAIDFCLDYQELVSDLILVSLCSFFTKEEIWAQERELDAGLETAMIRFYRRAFLGQKEDYRWFERELLDIHLSRMDLKGLKKGLDYLVSKDASDLFITQCINKRPRLFYGAKDVISPFDPMFFKGRAGDVRIEVIKSTGHLPFLSPEFRWRFKNS
ncbi:MAG: alpha/beta fold hydrolase [Dissulfurimicrobium sp.]|uniref:alpha/beta fold hydrolase n=1 Tax=Dissulfurimicrobium sp. TaxID=2022436 RepID=UPI00404A2646